MRGRKPKPTWLKLLDGNTGGRPLNKLEPVPEHAIGTAPADFNAKQREIWEHATAASPPGLLTELDRQTLIGYCVSAALYEVARGKVNEHGALVKTPVTGVPMQSPWLTIQNKQFQLMQKAVSELGFSPTSRPRVKIERKLTDTGGGFADLKEIVD